MTCILPRQGLYAPNSPPPPQHPWFHTIITYRYKCQDLYSGVRTLDSSPVKYKCSTCGAYACDTSRVLCTTYTVPYPCKRRFPVRFRVLTGLTHATLRADCGSCVLARLMHATGLCATGGCRIQASTRDRLVHKSGLCTRHYGIYRLVRIAFFHLEDATNSMIHKSSTIHEV